MPTDVLIDLWANQVSGPDFDVSVEVCVEPGGVGKTMNVFIVQSLSTYPASRSYNRNTVMQGLDPVEVTVAAGGCETVTKSMTFDPVSWGMTDQMQLTAWAQDPAIHAPAEVHQAKQVRWPFPSALLFADGFEGGDTGSWSTTSP